MPLSEVNAMILDIFDRNLGRAKESAIQYGYEGDCVAIGHFDDEGDYKRCGHYGEALHLAGDDVAVRRVSDEIRTAYFGTVVDFVNGWRTKHPEIPDCNAHFSKDSGLNIWVQSRAGRTSRNG